MKLFVFTPKIALAGLFSVVLGLFSASAAHAQILFTIDESDPSHVIISATSAFSSATTSPSLIADGVDLIGFFTGNVSPAVVIPVDSTSLTTGNQSSGPTFNEAESDNISTPYLDLDLFHNNTPATITFTSGQTGFLGNITLNLSGLPLPKMGAIGTIVTGFSGDAPANIPIGQYEVIPEPSTSALMLLCLGALAYFGRRLRRA